MTVRAETASGALDEKIDELRELIREANGVLKDLRHERKEVTQIVRDFREQTDAAISVILKSAVTSGLASLSESISKVTDEATAAVYDRFDLIAAICLGEENSGDTPTEDLVRRYVEQHGPIGARKEAT